jgi:hypothetical protein
MVGIKRARPLDARIEYRWRAERARSADYVADFALIGEQALRRWPGGRTRLFKLYFLELKPYREALRLLGLAPSTFDYWSQEIKKYVGRALYRAGLYPPENYFTQPSKPRPPRRQPPEPPAATVPGGESEPAI